MTDLAADKKRVRRVMQEKLNQQSVRERDVKSHAIQVKLQKDDRYRRARTIMLYVATETEVQTKDLITKAMSEGKCVAVPFVDGGSGTLVASRIEDFQTDLQLGKYGILEPKPERLSPIECETIEVVVVPGMAFDQSQHRLGHGQGYYDRFLAKLPARVVTYGLGFDFQLVDALPVAEHDVRLNRVIRN